MKSSRAEWLKYCGCFIAGCLTSHQWFLHQHSTLDIAQSQAFHSPHAALTTPISNPEAPSIQSADADRPVLGGFFQVVSDSDPVDSVSKPSHILSDVVKAAHSATLSIASNADTAFTLPSSSVYPVLLTKPSWHRQLDCSVTALPDCFASQGAYAEYPDFGDLDLDTIIPQTKVEAAAKSRQREIDATLIASLRNDVSSASSAASLLSSSTPATASVTEADAKVLNLGQWACAAGSKHGASDMSAAYDAALAGLASDAASFPGNHRAAFTMADKNYAHQISEVGVMAKRFGLPVLLFACLDAQCLAAGCRTAAEHNQPATTRTQSTSGRNSTAAFRAALIPGSSNSEANTKARVEHGKFWTAWQLAQRGTDFVFFEMDVWLVAPLGHSLFALHYPSSYAAREKLGLRLHRGQLGGLPPLTLVDRGLHARHGVGSGSKSGAAVAAPNLVADLLVSTHQDVPFSLNIGFFSVQGNPKTASFFARLLSKLAADPSLKDQRVFINLCRHPADDEDMWGGVFGLIPPLFVASHVKPWRMPETLAVHVLSNRPLTVPHGKALVAKELGAWTGADGYYHEDGIFEQDDDEEGEEKEETDVYKAGAETMGSGRESLLPPRQQQSQQQQQQQTYRRYLALDSHALSMNNRDVNHHPTYLRAMLAVMVAVAKATGRILILPAVFHDAFYVYAWNHLDLKSVEELGVEWRETNFLRTLGHRRQALARRRAMRAASAAADAPLTTALGYAAERANSTTVTSSNSLPLAAAAQSSVWGKGGLFGWGDGPWDVVRVALLDGAIAVAQSSSDPERTAAAAAATVGAASGSGKGVAEVADRTVLRTRDANVGPSGWRFHRVPRRACLGSGLWPLLLDGSTVQSAPLLLLRMPVLDGLSPHYLQGGSSSSPFGAPSWVADIYTKLRWCDADRKGGIFKPKSASVAMSADDCYGRGIEGAWK